MGIALMYFYNGFYVIFFTVMFCDFAPKTGRPEFWTGMGRVVRCAFVALAVMPVMRVYETAGSVALVVISCALSITLLLVLLPHIVSALKKEAEVQAEALSDEELMQRFANRICSRRAKLKCSKSCFAPKKACRKSLTGCLFQGVFCKDIFHLYMKNRNEVKNRTFSKLY